jgi:hypothetical protein
LQVHNTKWGMDNFTNLLLIKFWNVSAGIRMDNQSLHLSRYWLLQTAG